MEAIRIRKARQNDLEALREIYNQAVEQKSATGHQHPLSQEEMEGWWKCHLSPKYPVFVAEIGRRVVGWNSLSPYRAGREAFRSALETSYYVGREYWGRGVAHALMKAAMQWAGENGVTHLMAILLSVNGPSIRFLERWKFKEWGRLPGIAKIGEQRVDHLIYGIALERL